MALSGAIHLAITPERSEHAPAHGLFFAALGVVQIGWAAAYWMLPGRWLRWTGFVLSGGMIVLWAVTRSLPAPFSGTPEEIDMAGVASKILEAIAMASLLVEDAREYPFTSRQARLAIAAFLLAVFSGLGIYASALALEPIVSPILPAPIEHEEGEAPSAGHAHAGARRIRLEGEPAGPYLVRAVTSFGPDRLQDIALEVRVVDAASRRTLTDPEVRIVGEDESGRRLETAAAQGEAKIPRDYAAVLALPAAGAWHIAILVDGPRGQGQVGFDLLVPSGGGVGGLIGAYLPFGGLFLLIIAYILVTRARPTGSEAPGDNPSE